MRGDKESACFDKIKHALFYKDGMPICNPFDGCSAITATDDSFAKAHTFYCNSDFNKNYFGLLENERLEFANIIRAAKPNPSSSKFPDFIFDNGFIEHFQITSSQITRKGAFHARKESEFQRRVERETEELKKKWNETPSFDRVRSESWAFQNPAHSYTFLIDSFKQNWERHLESYQKYSGKKDIGIFMIEYPETALAMCENVYGRWIDGMAQGDMREQESFKDYRLSRDKKLLKYIYDFNKIIKYVIFVNPVRCDVIRTKNIPYLIRLMPWDYLVYPMQVCTMATVSNITIPVPYAEGDESNDKT